MACTIVISDIQLTDVDLTSIEVSGHADECDSVIVGISCLDSHGPFLEVTVPVGVGGAWVASFPDPSSVGCRCAGTDKIDVFAVARCASDPDCEALLFKKSLACIRCPTVDISEPEHAPTATCGPDGTVQVTLKAQVANTSDTDAVVHIECGSGGTPVGGTNVFLVPANGGSALVQQTCKYNTPVTPEPFVTIDVPAGCPETPIDVAHQICCPDPASIQVTVGECVDGKRQVTFDLGGSFAGSIDFGDGDPDLNFNAAVFSHDYVVPQPAGGYTAVLSIAFCEDIEVDIPDLAPCDRIGACCLPGGGCAELSPEDCAAQGGSYQGDGTTCEGVLGACILPDLPPDDNCVLLTQAACAAAGGQFQGPCTTCPPKCGKPTLIIAASLAVALAINLIVLALQSCLMVPVPAWVTALLVGVLIGAAAAWALWELLCVLGAIRKECCPNKCDRFAMTWIPLITGAIVALYFAGCCGFGWWVLVFGLAIAGFTAYGLWLAQCNPTPCQHVTHWLIVLVTAAGSIFAIIDGIFEFIGSPELLMTFEACDYDWVKWVTAIAAAILTVFVPFLCDGSAQGGTARPRR